MFLTAESLQLKNLNGWRSPGTVHVALLVANLGADGGACNVEPKPLLLKLRLKDRKDESRGSTHSGLKH